MSEGWFRCEISGHEKRVLWMRSHGLELDEATACDDLRVWQDRWLGPAPPKWPSLDDLRKRWGWKSVGRVQRLLYGGSLPPRPPNFEAWSDPFKLDEFQDKWDKGGTRTRRGGDRRGTKVDGQPPVMAGLQDKRGTNAGQRRDKGGHTRDLQPQHSTARQPEAVVPQPERWTEDPDDHPLTMEVRRRHRAAIEDSDEGLMETIAEELFALLARFPQPPAPEVPRAERTRTPRRGRPRR